MPTLLLSLLSLLSAFLLFQVQPVISKFILPWFGGSPGVWTTCMLFFQCTLFLGYAYAHGLMKLPHRQQALVHGALLIAALCVLPIAPGSAWKPSGLEDPAGKILLLLLANVALPYFILSSTSPLVQVWFSRVKPHGSPWRLYALSNIGSLAALLTYPFLIEPRLDVLEQTRWWGWMFVAFAALSLTLAFVDRSKADVVEAQAEEAAQEVAPRWWQRLLWVLLPAFASAMLLATTNHVCQDVAVIPFLWIMPLSLYLLTFIICFEHERWYRPVWFGIAALIVIFVTVGYPEIPTERLDDSSFGKGIVALLHLKSSLGDIIKSFKTQLAVCFSAMFLACMVCHGELTRLKPAHRHLTEFYLLMSLGGAVGGLVVSLVAPRVFDTFLEWPIGLICCFAIAGMVVLKAAFRRESKIQRYGFGIPIVAACVAGFLFMKKWGFQMEDRAERVRNFYGAVSVEKEWDDEQGGEFVQLHHGAIVHGTQWQTDDWRATPLSYYSHDSGIGRALDSLKNKPDAKVGIVGMGSATSAAYGQKGHTFRFYDINPDIVRLAKKHFTYLGDFEKRGGKLEIALGDARLNLEREPSQQFDVLLLDAFAGDSVPVHLLTKEAFEIYRRHMKPDGIIVTHVTNRYLSLAPVIEKVAAATGYKTTRIITEVDSPYEYTDYVLVTNNEAFLKANPVDTKGYESAAKLDPPLWTDLRHDLWGVLERE